MPDDNSLCEPVERSIYAVRNVDLLRQAEPTGAAIGRYAAALLDSPLPSTRVRRVYALLGLQRRLAAASRDSEHMRDHE